ncbi:HAMP domain-containing sensor histidine kinase [uncultured Bacteroides sp.]|uniref:sensor histidine kinase n=1 Tax=uncultured Bacteroides sp. TaxID=162156 RepID=UPI002AA83501|nr:HAMP domain-containing sensor histidine kinase [uncultured Bacteroides sp.]
MTVFNYFRHHSLLFFLLLFLIFPISSFATPKANPILIISSYNPNAFPTSANISDFMDEYHKFGEVRNVVIENMNCKSFSESELWKQKMNSILHTYTGNMKPKVIVLLGQEAWASFLSQDDSIVNNIPVVCCMVSRNVILLPDKSVSLKSWMPKSIDFLSGSLKHQVNAGFMYEYDVKGNVDLIKKLYPKTKNIVFISDNTYGGVSLQAYVKEEMKSFPNLNLILLDGRSHTIYTMIDELQNLPPNSAILLGTWKVDKNDGYFMYNATYAMMDVNPKVPVFSLTSIGFGYWAIGGIMPNYHIFGRELAHMVMQIQKGHRLDNMHINIVENKMSFDSNIVKKKGINLSVLSKKDYQLINEPYSFYKQYKYPIWGLVTFLLVLIFALFISLFFYFRTKKLKDNLEISEKELRISKEQAEESNRLKTAFLANMSHEIRTPLNSIVGFSEVLVSGGNTVEEQQNYIDIIQTNSDLLLRLINDILDISKLEAGRVSFLFEKYDIVLLCRQVLASVDFTKKTGNEFRFSTSYDTFEMQTDAKRLQQVLFNLLSNADKFTNDGVVTLEFRVNEGDVEFSITDTGCGIPENKHLQIFERFAKLNEYAQGTGLGLSICKLVVDKWGGNIWVDKNYHDGARIVFTHPIIK